MIAVGLMKLYGDNYRMRRLLLWAFPHSAPLAFTEGLFEEREPFCNEENFYDEKQIELKPLYVKQFDTGVVHGIQCSICLVDYVAEDKIAILPCLDCYHEECISQWLKRRNKCPICKRKID